MTTATAAAESAISYRSRRRIAVWVLALTLGGAAAGTATTLAGSHDHNAVSKAGPTMTSSPSLNTDSPDSYNYKLGPGSH